MIITITKGGVGKTTLAANLGGYLADLGKRVLAVDADIQPTLSSYYPIEELAPNGLSHLITEADVTDVISRTTIPNLDLIYSDDPKGALQNFIIHTADGRQRLEYTLRQLQPKYDIVLNDTQGAVGPLQESAIFAGDIILTPIRPDRVSVAEFHRGTVRVVSEQRTMGKRIGLKVGPIYGLLYGIERTSDARSYLHALTELLDGDSRDGDISLLVTRVAGDLKKLTSGMFGNRVSGELSGNALFDVYWMVTRIREGCGRQELAGLARRLHFELTHEDPDE
ncbi:MAG: ParA family protein [Gammaproteobacteria bacterium]|nr:ParA family protein [Gammaproteobacteria bacterium]